MTKRWKKVVDNISSERFCDMDDSIRNAIRFIGQELKDNPELNRAKLLEDAAQRFDLSPLQSEFLVNKFLINKDNE
jgi:hypothetical protein